MTALALAGTEAALTGALAAGTTALVERIGTRHRAEPRTPTDAPSIALRLATGVLCAAVAWVATGWPAAGVWAALAGWAIPGIRQSDRARTGAAARLDAWASWVGLITGQLAAQASLAEALLGACERAPGSLVEETAPLANALAHLPLDEALAAWAVEGSASTELRQVAMVLSLAAAGSGGRVVEVLGSLGAQIRARAASARRIERERRRTRVAGRAAAGVAVVWLVLGSRFDASLFDVYRSGAGQVLLFGLLGIIAAGLWGLTRLDRGLA